jgi:hypothetical protein
MIDLKPELTLNPETAFFILLKAREFGAKVEAVDPDEGSNPADDKSIDVLEFQADDTVEEEVAGAINALNVDEQLDLIALSWIGRGDYTFDDWAEAREEARRIGRTEIARYVLGHPTLSDDLEEAMTQLGFSTNDYLDSHSYAARPPEQGADTD